MYKKLLEEISKKYLKDPKNYVIEETIQENKNSTICLIADKTSGKKFIIKTIPVGNKNKEKLLFNEMNILAKVQNPTIFIQFHGYSEIDMSGGNNRSIFMDYMENGSLSSFLKQKRIAITNTTNQIILTGVACGMMVLHEHNIIHRDLKPGNILIDKDFHPHIIDFGYSKFFNPYRPNDQSVICGTTKYMAREVYTQAYDIKVDVFSFGKILQLNFHLNESLLKMAKLCTSENPDERPTFREIFKKLILEPKRFESYIKFDDINPLILNDDEDDDGNKYCLENVDKDEFFSYVESILKSVQKQFQEENKIRWSKTLEICQQIFSLKTNQIEKPTNNFLVEISTLLPDETQINDISKNIQFVFHQNADVNFYLVEIKDDYLSKISNNKIFFEDENSFQICSLFIFYSWISSNIMIVKKQDNQNISTLLSLLNHISQIDSKFTDKKNYNEIAASCFVNFIEMIAENNYISDYMSTNILNELNLFFKRKENLTLYAENILCVLSSKALDIDDVLKSYEKNFIDLINKILEQDSKVLSSDFILSIIQIKSQIFDNMTLDVSHLDDLCLLLNLFKFKKYKDYETVIQFFCNLIFNGAINKSSLLFKTIDDKEELMNFEINDKKLNNHPFNVNQIDLNDFFIEYKAKPLSSFFTEKFLKQITLFKTVFLSNEDYAKTIISLMNGKCKYLNLSKLDKKTLKFILILIFYFAQSVKAKFQRHSVKNLQEIIKFLFDKNIKSEIVDSLRDSIFCDYFSQVFQFFSKYSNNPILFYENLCRLASKITQKSDIFIDYPTIDLLVSSLLKYRVMNDNDPNKKLFLNIRKTILYCFKSCSDKISKKEELIMKMFQSDSKIKECFKLLLEPPIRNIFDKFIIKYLLLLNDIKKANTIIIHFNKLFKTSKLELTLIADSLQMIYKAMSNTFILNAFRTKSSILFNNLLTINASYYEKESIDYLLTSIIDLFKEDKKFDQIALFESLIEHFIKYSTQDKILNLIINFIKINNYEMKHTELFCFLVRTFLKTDKNHTALTFISDCCLKSSSICMKCHECELDLLLINILKEWKKKIIEIIPEENKEKPIFDENEEGIHVNELLIKKILDLFTIITTIISSATVVQSFFSMLSPIDDSKHLSLIHKNFIECLNNIFIKSRKIPMASLPILPCNEVNISRIPPSSFYDGISFVFWLSLSSTTKYDKFNLFKLETTSYSEKQSCKAYITDNKVCFKIKVGNEQKNYCQFDLQIPDKIWTMLTLEITPNTSNNDTTISLYINKDRVLKHMTNSLFLPKSDVSCIVNHDSSIKSSNDPSFIGLFILSKKLDPNEISNLNDKGQITTASSYSDKIIFAYLPQSRSNIISFKPLHKNNQIIEEHKEIKYVKKILSFSDFIITYYKIDIIIPIFYLIKIPTKDGSMIQSLPLLSVDVLTNLFIFGDKVQYSLNTCKSINAISHLLMPSEEDINPLYLTFSLYEKFYNLLQIVTDDELKFQLIDVILLNFNLWSKSAPEQKIEIFKHWTTNLYSQNKDNVDLIKSPEWFLYIIQSCFLENLNDCGNQLLPLANEYFEIHLSLMNILTIFQYITFQRTPIIAKNRLLHILLTIFRKKENLIKIKDNIPEICLFLIKIIKNKDKDDEIIFYVIQIFALLIDSLSSEQSSTLIQYFIESITSKKYVIDINNFISFISVIYLTEKLQLIPILFAYTIFGGNDYLESLLTSFEKDFNYYFNEQSLIYPALVLFHFYQNEKFYPELIDLFTKMFIQHFDKLIDIIEIIGYMCFDVEITEKITKDILFKITLKDEQLNNIKTLIKVNSNFILFRFHQLKVSSSSSINLINIEDNNNLTYTIKTLQKNLKTYNSISYQFGIRIDNENNWIDEDLANQTLTLIEKYKLSDFNQIKKILNQGTKIKSKSFFVTNKQTDKNTISLYNSYLNSSLKTQYNLNKFYYKLDANNNSFNAQLKKIEEVNYKIWTYLKKTLTNSRAPWAELITRTTEKVLKRDKIFGSSFCPYKVKYSNLNESQSKAIKTNKKDIQGSLRIKCNIITPNVIHKDSLFIISRNSIYLSLSNGKSKVIPMENVYSIISAYYYHSFSGIQIFTKTGKTYLLNMNLVRDALTQINNYSKKLRFEVQNSHPKIFISSLEITKCWLDGKISNFEYLMKLNFISGRSFNITNQYPIFPWILANYEQNEFNLNSLVYRDLSKPMGALNNGRLEHLKQNKESQFLYKICYSNQFFVNNCLARLEPFKHLDTPDDFPEDCNQLLTSISESFKSATTSPNNFYELIPEFFFLPEFLKSANKSINNIDDVQLPPWANNSPFDFVYLHRKALESDYVSSHLNEWIDLIWGCKQNGDEAIKSDNVFNPKLYETYKESKEAKRTYGQIPRKLFDKEHPKKEFAYKCPISYFKDENVNSTIVRLNGILSFETADVYYSSNHLSFTLISTTNIYSFTLDLSDFKSQEFPVNLSSCKKIKQSQHESFINNVNILICNDKNEDNYNSLSSPMFINTENICFIDEDSQSVKIVNVDKAVIEKIIELNVEIISIMTSQEGWLAVYTNDDSITLYNVNNAPKGNLSLSDDIDEESNSINIIYKSDSGIIDELPYSGKLSFFRSTITCIAISQKFHTFICGTCDNYLLFCRLDLNKMFIDKMIKVKGKPNKITVTETFGFVAVFMSTIKNDKNINELAIFSINGDEIRSRQLDNIQNIVEMISVKSVPGGFDYLILADNKKSIFVFEAFYLDINKPIYKKECNSGVVKLKYIKELSILVAFCIDNTISIFHLPIKD